MKSPGKRKPMSQTEGMFTKDNLEDLSYGDFVKVTAVYPVENELEYLTLGLIGEAGEVAGKVKKVIRGDYPLEEVREDIVSELGDVLWYLASMCNMLGVKSISELARMNKEKLTKRFLENKIRGDGDNR